MITAGQNLFLRCHLGLGDHILTNGMVRYLAELYDAVTVPCKIHNAYSVTWMWSDNPRIHVVPVADDNQADRLAADYAATRVKVLKIGIFAGPLGKDWARDMYRHAGVLYEHRHGYWKTPEPPKTVYKPGQNFVHEDIARGFVMRRDLIPKSFTTPYRTRNFFDWCDTLANAQEIHCIDSSFAILADSIPTVARRLVLHLYATIKQKPAGPPKYLKDWEIIV